MSSLIEYFKENTITIRLLCCENCVKNVVDFEKIDDDDAKLDMVWDFIDIVSEFFSVNYIPESDKFCPDCNDKFTVKEVVAEMLAWATGR